MGTRTEVEIAQSAHSRSTLKTKILYIFYIFIMKSYTKYNKTQNEYKDNRLHQLQEIQLHCNAAKNFKMFSRTLRSGIYRRRLYVVCNVLTFVHPTQPDEIFGNVSTQFVRSLAIQ